MKHTDPRDLMREKMTQHTRYEAGTATESAVSITSKAIGIAAIGAGIGYAGAKTFEAITNKDLSGIEEAIAIAGGSTVFSLGNLFTKAFKDHRSQQD